MAFVAPKVVLTPLLIASASLAGRRWGALTSGWLLALPLTSGPIAIFISIELGAQAGTQAAAGSLVGATGQVAFSVGYALASRRFDWPRCLLAGAVGFVVAAIAVPPMDPLVLFGLALVAVAAGLPFLRPGPDDEPLRVSRPSRWDIPARAVVATALVVAISGAAPIVGGHAAGILATFPVYVSVLTTFAQRIGGPTQARAVLRGLLIGLPGFATFFLVASATLVGWGVLAAFGAALVAAVVINVAAIAAVRWRER